MSTTNLAGKIQTVLGLIDPDELGVTLAHEHLICDLSAVFTEPSKATDKEMAHCPVSLDMLWWLRYHMAQNLDDLFLRDEQEAIEESKHFKRAGGNSIVEMSNIGDGRDPEALARIARATGLNIIMGSGYYIAASFGPEMDDKTEEQITEEITRDITEGVGNSGIHSGLIGEIGTSWPITDNEMKSLRAAGRAQKITGANLNVHPGQSEEAPMAIIKILDGIGADISRTTIDHIDRALRKSESRIELARTSCCLEYDIFGREGYYPRNLRLVEMPNDMGRINEIIELIEKGYLDQILLSQDICNKMQQRAYGGWGYAHILENTLPVMLAKGITREQIHTMMVDNPKRMFTFV